MATGKLERSGLTITGGLQFARIPINATTNTYGLMDVPNPTGIASLFLLRSIISETGDFALLSIESASSSTITLRVRRLSNGEVFANTQYNMTIVVAYLA